jgi:hypothetical protein
MTPTTTRYFLIAALMASSAFSSGCASLVPFTQEIRSQHNLTDDDLQHLQFYVSNEVTLRREIESRGRIISGGQLEVTSGKLVEEVVIQEHTPGVVVTVGGDALAISFEEGSALTFSLQSGSVEPLPLRVEPETGFATPPDPFPGEQTVAHDPSSDLFGNYFLRTDSGSTFVSFRGKVWEAVEESVRAHLMIDSESLEEVVEERTVLGGRRLGKARSKRPVLSL